MTLKVIDGTREIHLPAKTSEIVRAVIEVSAEIERTISGKVIFHFKGRSVAPEISRHLRRRELPEPVDIVLSLD